MQDRGLMRAALESVMTGQGLASCPALVDKALQLHDSLKMRLGVMLIGPAGKLSQASSCVTSYVLVDGGC